MRSIEREFYHSARGPRPSDAESWRLVFDRDGGTLLVRHEWNSERHAGVDEFGIGEFLTQTGAHRMPSSPFCSARLRLMERRHDH